MNNLILSALLLVLTIIALSGCHTVIYDGSGNKLAVIYSNATDVTVTKSGNGKVTFAAATVDNSTPTREIGNILKAAMVAWGTVAAIKHADDTINAFTGNHLKR